MTGFSQAKYSKILIGELTFQPGQFGKVEIPHDEKFLKEMTSMNMLLYAE